jgi:hypothetical protein
MKNINESELRNYIFKKLQESYFDDLEFDDEAMKAAMSDINASGEEFEELGASKFEKDPKFKEKFTAALNRANLELPSDEDEVERLANMMKDRKSHEEKFGVGSLNETEIEHIKDADGKAIKLGSQVQLKSPIGYVERFMVGDDKNMLVKVNWTQDPGAKKLDAIVDPKALLVKEETMEELNKSTYNNAAAGALDKGNKDLALDFLSHSNEMGIEDDKETEETSRYMFFSNLQQIRRQAGLILDMNESEIQEILENGHDWAQDHIATAKESIDQVFDFIMNETKNGDMWKSVDLEDREDEEGIEEGMGLSHTVGKGTNEKPVNYPEELMRESIKNALGEVFGQFTSTSANARPVSFSKATLTKQHSTLSAWIQKNYPNTIVKMEMPAKTIDKKNPDALKPSVYLWIPTNNQNAISVEYRNVPNAVNTAKLQTTEILKAYPTLVVADPLKVGKDATQATYSLTLKPEESKNTAPSTTAKPALAESFMKEDEHHTLSFLDKIKLKLAGVSEEKALENLNNGLPIDWTGSLEGYHDRKEPRGNYSGTNEGLEEDMDKTDYYFNKAQLDYETQEDFNKEVYYVIDNEFNQTNYPDLVGKTFDTPPSYAEVEVKKQGEIEESSSDSLINKHGANAKPDVEYLKEGVDNDRYEQVIYLQDHEADHALNILMQDGEDEAMDYLMQWHQPGNHETSEETGFGSSDKTYERDGYIMAWNPSLGYISLVHDLDSSIDEDSQRKRHTVGQLGKVSKNIPLGQNAPHSDSAEGL